MLDHLLDDLWPTHWTGALFLALHVSLAITVTIHALLHKRNVAAAIGWIGLAWLSPPIGSVLYGLLGINRVQQRAQRTKSTRTIRHAPQPAIYHIANHLAPLERAASRITHRAAQPGSHVAILHCGDEAYPQMLQAIETARHSIGLSSYILRNDHIGGRFIQALIAAQTRGVQVRVLVDGIGSGYFLSGAYQRLKRASVPVARFMHSPLPWKMPFLNLRTHKKILVVDGTTGFTGGLNIGDENLLAQRPPHPVQDLHFRFQGRIVSQLTEAFARDWERTSGEVLPDDGWFAQPQDAGQAVTRVITSGPDQDLEKIKLVTLQAIACARTSIQIVTPYFLPDEELITALSLAALRGVEVDIILPQRSNHRLIDCATRAHVGPLLQSGCRIWRNPPPFDHSKLMVVDEAWCMIGSANWDTRSLRLNFEMNVEIYHSDLARLAAASLSGKCGQRLRAEDLKARPLPVRLMDAALRLMSPYL